MMMPSNALQKLSWSKPLMTFLLLLLLLSHCLPISYASETNVSDLQPFTELTVENWEATFQSQVWTCLLLYDPWDEAGTRQATNVLQNLMARANRAGSRNKHPIKFARLNMRQHLLWRDLYLELNKAEDEELDYHLAHDYYDNVPEHLHDDPLASLIPETLLEPSLGVVTWSPHFLVVANNYNLYARVDLFTLQQASPGIQTALLQNWLHNATKHESLAILNPLVETPRNQELDFMSHRTHVNNEFRFERYFQELAIQEQQKQNSAEYEEEPNIRLLLENDSHEDDEDQGFGAFTYEEMDPPNGKDFQPAHYYLIDLGTMINEYLTWVEGYEQTWSPERIQREDEQLNFGKYWNQMNERLLELMDGLLLNADDKEKDPQRELQMRINKEFAQRAAVPEGLHEYLVEMVFGAGRSPAHMHHVMLEMRDQLGPTPPERRANRWDFQHTEASQRWVHALRQYLALYAETVQYPKKYSIILAELVAEWYTIMRLFHKQLNQHYTQYLANNPRSTQGFQFRPMDILDMENPDDYYILTNYTAFHEKYTATGTPVVLSNVRMTRTPLTLDSIVEQCAMTDVTDSVHVSNKVGERQAGTGWGGLEVYVLDDALMNRHRRETAGQRRKRQQKRLDKKTRRKRDDDDDDEEDDDGKDRSLTMEQFSILSNRIDTLYLHDFGLPERCDKILYDHSPYDHDNAKFFLPYVIGSYDLLQRLPLTAYSRSWPSLFVGKKGTNSKLHTDSGATGFFMYLVEGRKRWIVYNRDEKVHLYEKIDEYAVYPDVLAMGKNKESDKFLSHRFPLLHRPAEEGGAYEIIQEPGQLVYIPPNCPHAVENLEDIIGLAMNIVPRDGISNHLQEQIMSGAEMGLLDMTMNYWLFEDGANEAVQTMDPLYTTFGEYKAQY